ncbi:MAG: 50S ribosomal protein L15 [Candidatus Omnitrophica bacterium CG1_02_40_15]|nr:MAG: 50S ribosomal protein L15 [Candidatus Omnitrophica bacterium CG1_02_40_15]
MKIQDLRPAIGARKRRKIVGRGPGSGHGKTSTRGHKGQMSRSGAGRSPGFEGGQMPLIRKLPKRGFRRRPKAGYSIVNLEMLSKLKKEALITIELLKEKGMIKGVVNYLKILGKGEIKVPVHIKAHAFSKSVEEKIKAVGGKCEVLK